MNAAVPSWEEHLAAELAKRPTNASGAPLCECGAVLTGESRFLCDECARAAERRREEEDRQRRLEDWRNGVRYSARAFPTWEHAQIGTPAFEAAVKSDKFRRAAERYALEHGDLVLLGDTGSGKTTTIAAIARRMVDTLIERGPTKGWKASPECKLISGSYFIRASKLVRAMRRHPLGSKDDAPELERCFACTWLVIDDLGLEPPGNEHVFSDLLDERYERRGAGIATVTMMTSGFTREQIAQRYGAQFLRRFVEPKGRVLEAFGGNGGR